MQRNARGWADSIAEAAPGLLYVIDFDGHFIEWNAHLERVTGHDGDELATMSALELFAEGDKLRFAEAVRAVAETGEATTEAALRHKEGGTTRFLLSGRRLEIDGRVCVAGMGLALGARKLDDEVAERGEEVFRIAFERSPLGKSLTGVDGSLRVNQSFCDMLGYSRDELRCRSWRDITHPDDLDESERIVRSLLAGQVENVRYEKRYLHKRGHVVWTDVTSTLHRDARGAPRMFITTVMDITARKQTEEELRQAERQARLLAEELQTLMAVIPTAVWVSHDPECRVITGNNAAGRFYEARPDENVSAGPAHGPEHDTTRRFFRDGRELAPEELPMQVAVATGKEVADSELQVLRPSGLMMTILGGATPLFDPDGRVRGCVGAFADITERKNAEIALRRHHEELEEAVEARTAELRALNRQLAESEARFRAIAETVPVGVVVTRKADAIIAFANPSFAQAMGRPLEALVGHPAPDLYWDPKERVAMLDELQDRGRVQGYEIRYKRADGTPFWAAVWIQNISFAGEPSLLGAFMDIDEQKRRRDEVASLNRHLEQRTAQLEATNQELEAFSYSVSHDLRAPLRAIEGFSQALMHDHHARLDVEGKDFLERSAAAARRMGQLIDDLLALSRISRKGLELQPVDLTSMGRSIIAELQRADPSRVVDSIVADDLTAMGDRGLFHLMLVNLLGNAWKFTAKVPRARIELGTTQSRGRPAFFVRDNGAGFEQAYAGKLFSPFHRLHKASDYPGTGIGLATVQRIVRRHGGEVWAESRLDRGATFYFTLTQDGEMT